MTGSSDELRAALDPTPTRQDVAIVKPVVLETVRSKHPQPVQFRTLVEVAVPRCAGIPFVGFPPHLATVSPEVVSAHVRWATAIGEALNDLYHAGLTQPRKVASPFLIQSYVPDTRGGNFKYFDEREVHGEWILTTRGVTEPDRDFLFDADLYLQRAGLSAAHRRIQTSVTEAVTAYRQELYLASATMVGSASEGAWLEFFEAFGRWADKAGANRPAVDGDNLVPHVMKVVSQYKGYAGFDAIMVTADVSGHELTTLVQRYDYLRDIRNYAAHFDTTERFDLTYGGVGVLLLDAARYFAALYRLIGALRIAAT